MTDPRPNYDGRIFGEAGQPDYFMVGFFWPKLGFAVFAGLLCLMGLWLLYAPMAAWVLGKKEEARVSRIVRVSPGEPERVIRMRRAFEEEGYSVVFRHYVEVVLENETTWEMRMAVDSRRKPYASVNDTFYVVFHPGETIAFGLFHHRTWGFGLGFLGAGLTLLCIAIYLLLWVGKPVFIDPESPENIEKERLAEERARQPNQARDGLK